MQRLKVFIWVLVVLCAWLSAPAFAQFKLPGNIPSMEVNKIAKDLYTFRWGPYRSMFMVTKDGVILTDPISVAAAKVYRAEIRKVTKKPVKYVVYSHSHWDHALGGKIFKDEGAEFVAQKKCAQNIAETPHPDLIPPDITFENQYSVELGGKKLDLFYFGPSHDNCLIVMIPRPEKMMLLVDVANPPDDGFGMPFNAMLPDTHIYNMIPFLQAVEDLAKREGITTAIGGHISISRKDGKIIADPPTGRISVVEDKRKMWEFVTTAAKAEWDKGTYAEDIPIKIDMTQFEKLKGYKKEDMVLMLRRFGSYFATGR
ncbi:MAG: MBL fold metallo-hydrolase [Rhodospirillaceae bacterium]|nr:MBL fold metallo-hydrolase [Rhodospirillaceae bacterium]